MRQIWNANNGTTPFTWAQCVSVTQINYIIQLYCHRPLNSGDFWLKDWFANVVLSAHYTKYFRKTCPTETNNTVSAIPVPPASTLEWNTIEPVLKGHCNESPPSVLRPLGHNILWYFITNATSDLWPPAFCGHFYCAKGVASQERFLTDIFIWLSLCMFSVEGIKCLQCTSLLDQTCKEGNLPATECTGPDDKYCIKYVGQTKSGI